MKQRLVLFWLVLFCLGSALLAVLPAPDARADDMPLRKPGLWEMKIAKTGSAAQHVDFDHYNASVALTPPAKSIDISQLQGK